MMDHDNAEEPVALGADQVVVKFGQVGGVDMAGSHERCRGAGAGQSDDGDGAALAHVGKCHAAGRGALVAGEIRCPGRHRLGKRPRHIGVVVAGNDGNVMRRPEGLQPSPCGDDLAGQADVHQVAGDGDMIGLVRHQIVEEVAQYWPGQRVHPAPTPVDVADDPLGHQLERAGARQRAEMRIGEMSQCKHRHRT